MIPKEPTPAHCLNMGLICVLLMAMVPSIASGKTLQLDPKWTLDVPYAVRIITGRVGPLDVAIEDASQDDQVKTDALLTARFRINPTLEWRTSGFFGKYLLSVDSQLRLTPWGGEQPAAMEHDPRSQWAADRAAFDLDQAFLAAKGEHLEVLLGMIRPHFGLGLISNRGEDGFAQKGSYTPTVRSSPFGYARRGDRTMRFQVKYHPMGTVRHPDHGRVAPVALLAAGEMVLDDDVRRYGDSVNSGLFGGGAGNEWVQGMFGFGRRHQTHSGGGETEINFAVAWARAQLLRRDSWSLWTEGEVAGFSGTSTLSESVLDPSPVEVLSGGGVLRLGLTAGDFETVFEGGVASGDDSPFDRESHSFTFDREYRVGLLLFGELARANTAVEALNVTDGSFRTRPPRGYDHIPTAGAVRNAVYLNPRFMYAIDSKATVYLGYLYATAEEPVADAFRSGLAGGQPVGPRGARNAELLGHELDLAVEYRLTSLLQNVADRVLVKATGAVLFPGRAFDDTYGQPADMVFGGWLQAEANW